jgi:tetratricopeptide (TPR) repeat protein
LLVCDICYSSGNRTFISAEDMRRAVFKNGFNPYALGLIPFCLDSPEIAFERWKRNVVAQDTSDWNICARCMSILRSYLEGKPTLSEFKVSERYYQKGNFIGQKYEVVRVLAHGGFGVVYLVYSHETKEVYAFKTFKDEFLADVEARQLFREEANVWIELERHPYLTRAFFVDEVSGRLYISMEYVAPDEMGLNSLKDYLQRQPPDLPQSLRWAIQFCYGMEYAYSKGIRSHRDIKPANIMITKDRIVKITDFGLASVLSLAKSTSAKRMNTRDGSAESSTVENICSGTPTHMPPEQFTDYAACDQRSDIYAFGIVLYQMTTGGKLPFFSQSIQKMYQLHSHAQVPCLDSELFPIIKRCLEKRPARRYQTFKELRIDLELLLRRQTSEDLKPPTVAEFAAWEWNNKGISLEKVGRFEEALDCYDKSLEINSRIAEPWFNKGNSLTSLGHFNEAIKCHEEALKINPQHQMGWINKAVTLHSLGRLEEAINCCDKALEINPMNVAALSNKGVNLGGLGRFDEAIKCLDKALEIDPRYVKAWVNKGVILRRISLFDEAIKCYNKALEINPQQEEAWSNMGVSFSKLGRLEEALRCYNKALEFNPKNADYWFNKANIYLKTGRFDEAIRNFDKALEINPKHPGASFNRIFAKQRSARRNDARGEVR